MNQPHKPNPDNNYQVCPSEYGGHYDFNGVFEGVEKLHEWCQRLRNNFDDWERGGMHRRLVIEYDKTTNEEVARGSMTALYRSLHVFGLLKGDVFGPVAPADRETHA